MSREKHWHAQRIALGEASFELGSNIFNLFRDKYTYSLILVARAANLWQVPYSEASYWLLKTSNHEFHPLSWGGVRVEKYPGKKLTIQALVWELIKSTPQSNLLEMKTHLQKFGYELSRATICNYLRSWRWSCKIPTITQIQKYSFNNLLYYVDFCRWLNFVDLRSVKFCDEVHFDSRSMFPIPFPPNY